MVAAMASRNAKVAPVLHDPGAVPVPAPAPEDWQRLCGRTMEQAAAAEARA